MDGASIEDVEQIKTAPFFVTVAIVIIVVIATRFLIGPFRRIVPLRGWSFSHRLRRGGGAFRAPVRAYQFFKLAAIKPDPPAGWADVELNTVAFHLLHGLVVVWAEKKRHRRLLDGTLRIDMGRYAALFKPLIRVA